jgi:hypothetical protein
VMSRYYSYDYCCRRATICSALDLTAFEDTVGILVSVPGVDKVREPYSSQDDSLGTLKA